MVMERSSISDASEREQVWIETCIRHNIHQAGENNHPQALFNFQYGEGFIFERPNGSLWRVRKVFPREQQAFVTTLDGLHGELWYASRMVRIPTLYLECETSN